MFVLLRNIRTYVCTYSDVINGLHHFECRLQYLYVGKLDKELDYLSFNRAHRNSLAYSIKIHSVFVPSP